MASPPFSSVFSKSINDVNHDNNWEKKDNDDNVDDGNVDDDDNDD